MAQTSLQKPQMSTGAYFGIMQEIDDALDNLKLNKKYLEQRHHEVMRSLLSDDESSELMNINEVQKMYQLVKLMRNQVLQPGGQILVGARVTDISSLISSMNSLITLFLKHQAAIDQMEETSRLKESLVVALRDLPVESQQKFYDKMNELAAL